MQEEKFPYIDRLDETVLDEAIPALWYTDLCL